MMVSYDSVELHGVRLGHGRQVTGIWLHNRGVHFVSTPGHPNQVGPHKRPYQTIIPAFMTKDGAPVMSFGVMGGSMQAQGHVEVVVRLADYGQNPQAACDAPRFRWVEGLQVGVEDGFPPAALDGLRERGHELVTVEDYNQFGSCQAIWRFGDGYVAASDPRTRRAGGRLLTSDGLRRNAI